MDSMKNFDIFFSSNDILHRHTHTLCCQFPTIFFHTTIYDHDDDLNEIKNWSTNSTISINHYNDTWLVINFIFQEFIHSFTHTHTNVCIEKKTHQTTSIYTLGVIIIFFLFCFVPCLPHHHQDLTCHFFLYEEEKKTDHQNSIVNILYSHDDRKKRQHFFRTFSL